MVTGVQRVTPRKDVQDGFFYVFVDSTQFPESGGARFFVLSDREAMNTLGDAFIRASAARSDKPRPLNPDSDDFWILPEDLEAFADDRLVHFSKYLR